MGKGGEGDGEEEGGREKIIRGGGKRENTGGKLDKGERGEGGGQAEKVKM